MPSSSPIKIFVVTVRHFVDRHAHIENLAAKFGFDFQYVLKFDADSLSEADMSSVSTHLSPKSASNVLKHIEAQRMFVDRSDSGNVALILEDDVVLFEDFFERLDVVLARANQLSPGFLVFLGGADNKIDKRFLLMSENELVESPITTAEAYLVDRFGCEQRLQWVKEHTLTKQADHQIKQIDSDLGLRQYRVVKAMATQGSITGMFETALDGSRAKRSVVYLKVKFKWNKLRRQALPRFLFRLGRFFAR